MARAEEIRRCQRGRDNGFLSRQRPRQARPIGTHVGFCGHYWGKSRHCRIGSKTSFLTHHVISAGLLAVVHNTYAAASIAAAKTTKVTAVSTAAHM